MGDSFRYKRDLGIVGWITCAIFTTIFPEQGVAMGIVPQVTCTIPALVIDIPMACPLINHLKIPNLLILSYDKLICPNEG